MLKEKKAKISDYIVKAHTSYVGFTGYNRHSQDFFRALNNFIPVRIRNFTVDSNFEQSKEDRDLIIDQTYIIDGELVDYQINEQYDDIKDANNESVQATVEFLDPNTEELKFSDEITQAEIASITGEQAPVEETQAEEDLPVQQGAPVQSITSTDKPIDLDVPEGQYKVKVTPQNHTIEEI